jgi:hypothetical protein
MLRSVILIFTVVLSSCSSQGTYTGVTTYGLGNHDGVKVYKTIWVDDEATRVEGVFHCNKYGRSARLLLCISGAQYCEYQCYDEVTEEVKETPSLRTSASNIDPGSRQENQKKPSISYDPGATKTPPANIGERPDQKLEEKLSIDEEPSSKARRTAPLID